MFQNEQKCSLFKLLKVLKAYIFLLYIRDFSFYFTAKLWLSFQLSLTILFTIGLDKYLVLEVNDPFIRTGIATHATLAG